MEVQASEQGKKQQIKIYKGQRELAHRDEVCRMEFAAIAEAENCPSNHYSRSTLEKLNRRECGRVRELR